MKLTEKDIGILKRLESKNPGGNAGYNRLKEILKTKYAKLLSRLVKDFPTCAFNKAIKTVAKEDRCRICNGFVAQKYVCNNCKENTQTKLFVYAKN